MSKTVKSLSQGTSFLWKLKKKVTFFYLQNICFTKQTNLQRWTLKTQAQSLFSSLILPPPQKMWRTIDAHLKTVRLPVRTVLLSHHQNPPSLPSLEPPESLHFLSLSKTLTTSSSTPYPPSPILAFTTRCINSVAFGRGRNLVPVRCISSISSSAAPNQQRTAVGWNEPVTCSELGDGGKGTNIEEDARQSIPVRAFLFSTRF